MFAVPSELLVVVAFLVGIVGGLLWAARALTQDPSGPPGARRQPTPWQLRGQSGLLLGLIGSITQLFSEPACFFRRVAIARETGVPIAFVLLIPMVVGPVQVLHQAIGLFPGPRPHLSLGQSLGVALVYAIAAPLMYLVTFLGTACVDHLVLMMVGRARNGFSATARAGAYSMAMIVAALIPAAGVGFALVMYPVLRTLGLSECHGATRGEAAAAVLVPYIACGLGVGGLLALRFFSRGDGFAPFIYTLF